VLEAQSSPSLSREMKEFGREPDSWEGKERAESDLKLVVYM
jgi:hypothetical protein